MSPERDASLLLSDILESVQTIRGYVGSMTNIELKADRKTMDAVFVIFSPFDSVNMS